MIYLYNLVIYAFGVLLRMAAWFHPKARLWVDGRRNWRARLQSDFPASEQKVVWVHAASLGEFEQGRPLIEAVREEYPDWKIVLSFFSPSGYEIRKNYPHADLVCYLPLDSPDNARDFIDLIKPDLAVFVKYEFWANYLFELRKRKIPTLLISGLFRPSQPFFRWYGGLWRKMLASFSHLFVQNEASGQLLSRIGVAHFTIAGDTRVDRVLKIAESAPDQALVADFVSDEPHVLIAGSTWPEDEERIFQALQMPESPGKEGTWWKLIVAPHEPSETNVQRICKQAQNVVRYSQRQASPKSQPDAVCLVIDNIGLLNTLYRYGTVAYIGGGFGKGIHNTLEPAAFGLPIVFGPKYEKFEEARQFVARGGAFPVRNATELADVLSKLSNPDFYRHASDAVHAYLEESRGATDKVMAYIAGHFRT